MPTTCLYNLAPNRIKGQPMKTFDPRGGVSLNPRGLIDRIYLEDYYTLIHTKYISCVPHGFRNEDFKGFFSNYKSMESHDLRGGASLNPATYLAGFM